jgi:carbon starvation protein CstA
MQKFEKLAAVGAAGVAGGALVAYSLLIFAFRPVPTGGFSRLLWTVVTVAMVIPVAILAGAHLAFAKQLKDGASAMPR